MNSLGHASPGASGGAFGELLRQWRTARGMSQFALSLAAGVSARHLSFLENGRASPSREMVLTLAEALETPLRERNALLLSAGFAAVYRETPLDAEAMGPVRDAVSLLLRATEPNPAFVVNRRYDVLDANEAGRWILATFAENLGSFTQPYNMARLLVSELGMRPYLENWADVARKVLRRVRRELGGAHTRLQADEQLLRETSPAWEELGSTPAAEDEPLLVPVRFRRDGTRLALFTTIATLGTPLDVTLQELRIEMLFPANEPTKKALQGRA